MSPRTLFEIALRIVGLVFALLAVTTFIPNIAFLLFPSIQIPNRAENLTVAVTVFGLQFAASLAFFFTAPALAARLYPDTATVEEPNRAAIGRGDLYRVASFALGIYVLVQATAPFGRLITAGLRVAPKPVNLAGDVFNAFVLSAAGVLLIFGAQPIATFFANLRYTPETIPNQQFSLRLLFALIVLFGAALGLARWIYVTVY